MRINYGALFQEKSKDKTMSGMVNIPIDKTLWPPAWKEIYYKVYDRFESIDLPKPIPVYIDQNHMIKRSTCRDYKREPIDIQTLSDILYFSAGEIKLGNRVHRVQASGGGRYPIELYILNFKEGEIRKGVHHYNVKDHKLEYLWGFDGEESGLSPETKYMTILWAEEAAMAIVATAIPVRTVMKYGERGYKYIYLEAGAILQNIQNNAHLRGIGSAINGSTNEKEIEELLDIDGVNETVILSIVIGVPASPIT